MWYWRSHILLCLDEFGCFVNKLGSEDECWNPQETFLLNFSMRYNITGCNTYMWFSGCLLSEMFVLLLPWYRRLRNLTRRPCDHQQCSSAACKTKWRAISRWRSQVAARVDRRMLGLSKDWSYDVQLRHTCSFCNVLEHTSGRSLRPSLLLPLYMN
jgi:hypothetical protein